MSCVYLIFHKNSFWDLPEAFFRGRQRYEKSARIKSKP
jgi:hypothetical protein